MEKNQKQNKTKTHGYKILEYLLSILEYLKY